MHYGCGLSQWRHRLSNYRNLSSVDLFLAPAPFLTGFRFFFMHDIYMTFCVVVEKNNKDLRNAGLYCFIVLLIKFFFTQLIHMRGILNKGGMFDIDKTLHRYVYYTCILGFVKKEKRGCRSLDSLILSISYFYHFRFISGCNNCFI